MVPDFSLWDIKDRCVVTQPKDIGPFAIRGVKNSLDIDIDAYERSVSMMPLAERLRYLRCMATIDRILWFAKIRHR